MFPFEHAYELYTQCDQQISAMSTQSSNAENVIHLRTSQEMVVTTQASNAARVLCLQACK